jgi:hypothetical protein
LIVFAFAGDSTMTSDLAISFVCKPKRPSAGEYMSFRYLKPNWLLKQYALTLTLVVILSVVATPCFRPACRPRGHEVEESLLAIEAKPARSPCPFFRNRASLVGRGFSRDIMSDPRGL